MRVRAVAVIAFAGALALVAAPQAAADFRLRPFGTVDGEPATYRVPSGLAIDSQGRVYVGESNGAQVRRFLPSGELDEVIAAPGTKEHQIGSAYGIAIDPADNVYVADFTQSRIKKFSAEGAFIESWPSPTPTGVAIKGESVYVLDHIGARVLRYSMTGEFQGSVGSPGDKLGQLRYPSFIASAPGSPLYVSDSGNHRFQTFSEELEPEGVWGDFGRVFTPSGITLDSAGNAYLVNAGHHRIEKRAPDGRVLRMWQFSSMTGPRALALIDDRTLLYSTDSTVKAIDTAVTRFDRTVSLRYSYPDFAFKGVVETDQFACRFPEKVRIYERLRGPDHLVKTAQTGDRGDFMARKIRPKKGAHYYAQVGARNRDAVGRCLAARSNSVRYR